MATQPPNTVKAAQAVTATLALAGLPLLAAVGRGITLVLSPQTRDIFAQEPSATSPTASAYSIALGYGLPVLGFSILYLLTAVGLGRRRRWAWGLGLMLSVTGAVVSVTTVAPLLSYAATVLTVFQVALALLLAASWRYFWSVSSVERPAPVDLEAGEVAAAEAEGSS